MILKVYDIFSLLARNRFYKRQWMNCVNIKSGLWKVFLFSPPPPCLFFFSLLPLPRHWYRLRCVCGKSYFFYSEVSTWLPPPSYNTQTFSFEVYFLCCKRIGKSLSCKHSLNFSLKRFMIFWWIVYSSPYCRFFSHSYQPSTCFRSSASLSLHFSFVWSKMNF